VPCQNVRGRSHETIRQETRQVCALFAMFPCWPRREFDSTLTWIQCLRVCSSWCYDRYRVYDFFWMLVCAKMCAFVCVRAYTYIYVYIRIYLYIYTITNTHTSTDAHTRTHAHMHIHTLHFFFCKYIILLQGAVRKRGKDARILSTRTQIHKNKRSHTYTHSLSHANTNPRQVGIQTFSPNNFQKS